MEALLNKLEGPRILVVRGLRVILDEDLARLYGVTTKALNQAVRRNHEDSRRPLCYPLPMRILQT